jgi:murein DD-endopeptidase MepM/ murein hydrolase activator NlpD
MPYEDTAPCQLDDWIHRLDVSPSKLAVVRKMVSTSYTGAKMKGFLSNHESNEKVTAISVEPSPLYIEEARDSLKLNFDFILTGLTDKRLQIRFIKAAVYDEEGALVTYRHLNHNGIGTPGIHTIGRCEISGKETIDIFNPFFSFPLDTPLHLLRYMFTFTDLETREEYYYGNVLAKPLLYEQRTKLSLPLRGALTIMDGHDFYSHHRRFAMSIVRSVTDGRFASNFSRFAVDFTQLGRDGNTRRMDPSEYSSNYDFHFDDASSFYTDGTEVFAPADGEVTKVETQLDDLYHDAFSMDRAIAEDRIASIAGNYIVIKHDGGEYSHLYHLQKGSLRVEPGEMVTRGQPIARVGFSGAATTYSHLHYQLMDGVDFLKANPLPCKFSDVRLVLGSTVRNYGELALDTGDIIVSR